MREPPVKAMYVSPITTETTIRDGIRTAYPAFYLLQAGTQPLKLEYASKAEAQASRSQLLKMRMTYAVYPLKTFWALSESFNELMQENLTGRG